MQIRWLGKGGGGCVNVLEERFGGGPLRRVDEADVLLENQH